MVTKIRDWLYIGDMRDVCEEEIPADVTITVCQDRFDDNVSGEYHHFNMADGPHNAYGGDSSYELFSSAVVKALQVTDNSSVFIHCHMGQSRSAAVVIAVLAIREGLLYEEAYDEVALRRPQIHPDEVLVRHAKKAIYYLQAPPGHPLSVERGCVCPILDNNHGRGGYKGWIVTEDCRLHNDRFHPVISWEYRDDGQEPTR